MTAPPPAARAPDEASCDCCDEMVPADDIARVVAYGIETYACGRCRGEPQAPAEITIIGDAPWLRGEGKDYAR